MTDFLTKEKTMSEQTLTAANEAIFHLQLDTNEAVRYVTKTARVDPKSAAQAIKEIMTGYKNRQ